jgi:xanthine dehydrogenase small subunit
VGSLRFVLNDRPIEIDEGTLSPTTTLLRWLRDRAHLTGTKEGCAEGDCGACTVAILEDTPNGKSWRGVNSCLVLLPMVEGKRVVTVEGLRAGLGGPHLVQRALAEALGSQCGYCTPGVAMSLFEACYRDDLDESWKLDAQMCGNLCRCTGYRPIRDAAREVAGARPPGAFLDALAPADSPSSDPVSLAYAAGAQRWFAPASLEALWRVLEEHPGARLVAGGTDLSLEVTKRYAEPPLLVSLEALSGTGRSEGPRPLGAIDVGPDLIRIGALCRLSDLEAASRFALPPLERMLRYFGARQIKNRATVGGNLANASPIGDLAPVFLSLGAELVLLSKRGERRLPIDRFFESYRKTVLEPDEIVAFVDLPRPPASARLGAYKVSKRRELDISTVAAAFMVRAEGGTVSEVRLAYGGMAATPARARKTEAALLGRPWSEATVLAAAVFLAEDFQPISDHRGSAWFRATLAKNLLHGFFLETALEAQPRLSSRHTGTVEPRGLP